MGHRRRECRDFQIWDGSSSQYGRASSLVSPGLRSDGQFLCAASDSPPQYTDSKFSGVALQQAHERSLQWFDATHRHEPSPALIALPTLPSPLTFAPL